MKHNFVDIFAWLWIILAIIAVFLVGCKTTATQYKRIDGVMTETERLELEGLGDREAVFSDKSKIKTDTTTLIPDLDLDIEKLKD